MCPLNVAALKAIVLDVDGTLYAQTSVRIGTVWRLLKAHMTRPIEGAATLRVLRAYRRAQEILRFSHEHECTDLAAAQLLLASQLTTASSAFIALCVARWMHQEPLDLIARARRPGLLAFLHGLKARHIRVVALSDYPAVAKLDALDILPLFDAVITAQDPEIQVFKPSPRGLKVALARVGAMPHEALYVGDRVDIDAPTAASAGVPCVIIGRRETGTSSEGWISLPGYQELGDVLACHAESHRDSKGKAHGFI